MSPTAEQARTLEVLREARELIADPERWTRGAGARDANGSSVHPRAEEAVRWCAIGAIDRADPSIISDALDALHAVTRGEVETVNDRGGHKRVLALFDRAIRATEKAA